VLEISIGDDHLSTHMLHAKEFSGPNSESIRRSDQARSAAETRHMKSIGLFLTAGFILLLTILTLYNPYGYDSTILFLSIVTTSLGFSPLLFWLFTGSMNKLPVFELYMAFHAVCFGLAGFMNRESTLRASYSIGTENFALALIATILFMISHMVGFYAYLKIHNKRIDPKWRFELNSSNALLGGPYMLAVCLIIYSFSFMAPDVLSQILNGIAYYYFLILLTASVGKILTPILRGTVLFILFPAIAISFSGFSDSAIAGFTSTLLALGSVWYIVRKKIPIFLGFLVIAGFFFFQPGKSEYRAERWKGVSGENVDVSDFVEISMEKWWEAVGDPALTGRLFEESFRRLNHLHVTAAVVSDTPSRMEYRYGATYLPLFTKWIPRMFWQDKPVEDFGNRWAREYGYLNWRNTTTSFNLPWLPEMYINLGFWGVIFFSLLIGWLMGYLSEKFWMTGREVTYTAFGILIGLPFFTPESNISLMLGKILISCILSYISLILLDIILQGSFSKKNELIHP